MDEVHPNLWLGSYEAALDDQLPLLEKLGISRVVSVGCYQDWWQFRSTPRHLLVPIDDSPFVFISDFFEAVFRHIDEALDGSDGSDEIKSSSLGAVSVSVVKKRLSSPRGSSSGVLVHCTQGKSRSGALVIAYLMHKQHKGYSEVLNAVLQHRKKVMPNIGFQIQLRAFAKAKWSLSAKYSESTDLDRELAIALRTLSSQVLQLQMDIRSAESIFVTITKKRYARGEKLISKERRKKHGGLRGTSASPTEASIVHAGGGDDGDEDDEDGWLRTVEIGLSQMDQELFRKEWIMLIFLCHQFQQYNIAIQSDIANIMYILSEMYFHDLLDTFDDVFHPPREGLIMDYTEPEIAVAAAKEAYKKAAFGSVADSPISEDSDRLVLD
jgi:hypothetical protein